MTRRAFWFELNEGLCTLSDNPYEILGVSKTATQDEIKSAYRKLARALHPDVNPNDKTAEEKFKKVGAAHDLLSDPAKRAKYDAGEIDAAGQERARRTYRRSSTSGDPGFGGFSSSESFRFGENADDIFEELMKRRDRGRFGGDFGFGFGGGPTPSRGADAQYALRVSFEEAALGATKRITLPTGKNLDVKVPKGSADGAILRLKGQGGAGQNGGADGDALIEIKVDPHKFFTREGHDVLITVPISLSEAILGGKVTVPTISGKVALNIPAWSSSGAVLRLKKKGIPGAGEHAGDQLVTLKIVLPETPDDDLEKLIKKWAEKNPQDPRTKIGL